MNYSQALELLYGRGNEVHGMNLGLHRIEAVMRALEDPQFSFPCIHIAGTNGKGSVAAMAESILRRAGAKTGLYTSPHLESIRERIRVAGQPVSARRFAALATRIRAAEKDLLGNSGVDMPLTYFEFVTAVAFLQFACEKVDAAVIEVGMGGRLDATNIVLPRVCVITNVGLDHMEVLGDTLAEIAGEKAGIIKPAIPVISGCRRKEARRVVRARSRMLGAPLLEIHRSCRLEVTARRQGRCTIGLQTPARRYRGLRLALAGEHQAVNAALAVSAVEAFHPGIGDAAVRHGLRSARWPGRIDEYPARRRTLLDGAHNVDGARLLRDHLAAHERAEIHMVFGAMKDKDLEGMSKALFPLASSIHLAPIRNPRTTAPEAIAALHPRLAGRLRLHRSATRALHAVWRECPEKGLVVVTGSLYLVGELIGMVRKDAAH